MARGSSGLTVKTLQAPFEGARFTPTFFSIIAVGMLVVGLPLMAATAANLGSNLSSEIEDAINGRQSEGDINLPTGFSVYGNTTTGYDLVSSPYLVSPLGPFTNRYTDVMNSPLNSPDAINNPAAIVETSHTVIPNFDASLSQCVPNQVSAGIYGGDSPIAGGMYEIAYNISKGDSPELNDFRVARSLQVEANVDPASLSPTCDSYDWDWNLQLPPEMFNTSSMVTNIKFDIINDASIHGSSWGGSDYCITGALSQFDVTLMVNGTPYQSKSYTDYCGVVKIWNTSFNESNPFARSNAYRHTTGGEFTFELDAKVAFDLREFMDNNDNNNYSVTLKVENCGQDCPLGFSTSAATSTLQPIYVNYYFSTAEPDAYSTVIRGSAILIGLIFLICAIGATPLWNPLVANVKGGQF